VHPVSLIGGTKAGERGLSFFVNRELTSVLAPGVFVVAELTYLMLRLSARPSAISALSYFKGLSGTAGLLVILLFSATGYVVGYVLRELAFRLLGLVEKAPRIQRKQATDTARRVAQYFDKGLVGQCMKAHPYLEPKLQPKQQSTEQPEQQSAGTSPKAAPYRAGGANIENPDYESFVYAKLWVRNFSAGLNIDSIELEINMLAAALAPSALLAVDILVSVRLTWWNLPATIIGLALVWWVLFDALLRLRRTERWEAVRNLIMDFAMRTAAADYPPMAQLDEEVD
jgi:hypothetical protein